MTTRSEDGGEAGPHSGRIGPNAIIQMAKALDAAVGRDTTRHVFQSSGLAGYLDVTPQGMVDESDVSTLQAAVVSQLGADRAIAVSRDAGRRTGDYLLANRIPRAAQIVLRALPAPLASRLLMAAIGRNSWTFAGSGHYHPRNGRRPRISITGCPICRQLDTRSPGCTYYAATFERLFRALVHDRTEVREIACEASGADACVFEIRWDGRRDSQPARSSLEFEPAPPRPSHAAHIDSAPASGRAGSKV